MIKGIGFEHTTMKFPVGETHVKLFNYSLHTRQDVDIDFVFDKTDDIMELLLVCNALKHEGLKLRTIHMPYVPFGRQDRVAVPGECFSLEVFADLINSIGAESVEITDPHSFVTQALIKNCRVVEQHEVFGKYLRDKSNFYLLSPDGGAIKKIWKLAGLISLTNRCLGVVECSKVRDVRTGAITETKVHFDDFKGSEAIMVDDICDGGKTFIEIAKVLKTKNVGKITLMCTHGFFTKGTQVFEGLIDEIYTRNGKVPDFPSARKEKDQYSGGGRDGKHRRT